MRKARRRCYASAVTESAVLETPSLVRRDPNLLDFVISVAAILIPVILLSAMLYGFVAREALGRGERPDPTTVMTPLSLFVLQVVQASLTIFVCWALACRKYGRSFVEGLAIRPVSPRILRLSVLLGLLLPFGIVILPVSGESPMQKLQETNAGFALIAFAALIMPPVEEIYFRGFVFPIFRRYVGAPIGVLLVMIAFGAMHASQLSGEPFALAYVTFVGLVFTIQRYKTDSLVPSMVTHLIYNGTLVTFGVVARIMGVEAP